jgi:phosphopantothenoylcysteine decarboxylase/phosphopantothenate--cysteine ligase
VHVLVTAGATRNPIDAMRYLSARSTGTTGIALADALRAQGHAVHLLGSAEALLRAGHEWASNAEEYGSTRDLMERMRVWVVAHPAGAVIHAAAVGDYERADPDASKIPSGRPELTLTLTPTPKIADHVRPWGLTGPFVTFKAASPETSDDELTAIASRQRERTGSDLVFANVLGRTGERVQLVGPTVARYARREDGLDALVRWLGDKS